MSVEDLLLRDGALKGLRADAQRTITPEETLARVAPKFPAIGLTRLANITGLDVVGIPVILSVRPQSGYLAVDGGKGFTATAATASAAMECFERHAGELTPNGAFTATYAELPESARFALDDLPLSRNSLFSPDLPESWVWTQDIATGAEVAAPSVLVSLERHRHRRSSPLPFHFSSNGLNSGNTASEAIIGGLYEVIERDATTCTKVAWEAGALMRRVDLSTATSPDIAVLVEVINRAGLEVVVMDCTVDTHVPTFVAYLVDEHNPGIGLYHGYGTHLDPQVAVIRAICEAAQGRLVFIAGSRDDSFRHHRRLASTTVRANQMLLSLEPTVSLAHIPDESQDTFEADGRILVSKLGDAGFEQILAKELTHPDVGEHVWRVIVPGLEGYMLEDFAPGRRAAAWATAHASSPSRVAARSAERIHA